MIRLVFLVLAFCCCVVSAQSDQDLVDRFDRLYNAGRLEQALATAESIVERYPDSAWWRFNTGAVLAKLDRGDDAMVHLRRCADLGFSGIRSFEQNSDLDGLRERADFTEVLVVVRGNAERRMNEFKREAERHKPKSFVPEGVESPALIIALHGTGMDGESIYDALLPAASELGMALVCPDALRPSGDGFSWTYRDESQWFVEHLIERSVAEHGVDAGRVILVGFSQGANIALIMGQTRSEKLLGTVPICGHYEEQVADSDGVPAPCYLLTGARDPWRKTYGQAKRDFEAAGGAAQVRMVSGMGHELPDGVVGERELIRALRWVLRQAEE
jgi:predicted esterase